MTDTMSVKEAALLWNITKRRVTSLCKDGKIKSAKKQAVHGLFPLTQKNRQIIVLKRVHI